MPRIARIVATDYPHHITQRGNYKQTVFVSSGDYRFYLERLNEYCSRYNLNILCYCLMPNHVHYVAVPKDNESLAKTFNACHMRYAHYFNKKNRVTGHLWQGRFFSCVLDEPHVYTAVRYVETNPVRAGLVKKPEDWGWSSAKEHLKQEKGILVLADINNYMDVPNWKKYLSENENMEVIKKIRANTLNGRPLGNEKFVGQLENQFGRRLKALPRGRPWPRKELK